MVQKQSGIYFIKNKINGKVYVGSSLDINKRWIDHRYKLKYENHINKHLQASWKKHGAHNFEFIVEKDLTGQTEEQILAEEQTYIDKLWDGGKNCYNMSRVADKPDSEGNKIPVYQLDKHTREIIKEWPSAIDAEEALEIFGVRNCCIGVRGSAGGFGWRYVDEERAKQFDVGSIEHGGHGKKAVVKVDLLKGTILEEYESVDDATRKNGLNNRAYIANVCLGNRHSTYGMIFRFKDEWLSEEHPPVFVREENVAVNQPPMEQVVVDDQKKETLFSCAICGFSNIASSKGLATHIQLSHKLSSEEYTYKHLLKLTNRPVCTVQGCSVPVRYVAWEFKKYCKEHSSLASSEGGRRGGKAPKLKLRKEKVVKVNQQQQKETNPIQTFDSIVEKIKKEVTGKRNNEEVSFDSILEKIKKEYEAQQQKNKKPLLVTEESMVANNNPIDLLISDKDKQIMLIEYVDLGLVQAHEKAKDHSSIMYKALADNVKYMLFFSDEWKKKQDLITSMVEARLGKTKKKLDARKLVLEQVVNKEEEKKFFNENHISGFTNSKICFGLRNSETKELVCAMSLRIPVQKGEHQSPIEIARLASVKHTTVRGGFQKLLKRVLEWSRTNGYKTLLSYAELRFGEGNVYKQAGFVLANKNTGENYWYTNGTEREFRFKYRAQNGMSELAYAKSKGVFRVYGTGNALFKLEIIE